MATSSPMQEENDNHEGVVSESNAGHRRSSCVTQAPKNLIEEISDQ
jgi:hypothetical protein